MNFFLKKLILTGFVLAAFKAGVSQRYLSDLDSSLFIKDTVRPFLKRFDNLYFSGYIQSQFQLAETEGAKSYNGGDFPQFSKNRFMLRRARVKIDYFITKDRLPKALFTFQFDATERGVNVRDMFLRLYETKHHKFSLTTGIFARPYGFEVNLSSAFRETPERGRMSQILMPTERDLGAMISFESQGKNSGLRWLKMDAGMFNGQGLSGTTDFDSRKDFIGRITLRPGRIKDLLEISGGLSTLQGGWRQATQYIYRPGTNSNGDKTFTVDSTLSNIGKIAPRNYYGADIQFKVLHGWGETELRAEYWAGRQPGSATSTPNPGTLPNTPVYRRNFNGAFFYFLQHIGNKTHQLMVKYDWYDPNGDVSGSDIGKAGTNLSATDIRFSTLGLGYVYHFSDKVKLVLYYDIVKNEKTQLPDFTADKKDNIFTSRIQFRF